MVGVALFLTYLAGQDKTVAELRASYPQYYMSKNKIELTPMIGVNDTVTNLVSLTDATKIATWAKANGLAGLHYWSWDRDASCVNEYATTTCSSSVNGTPMQTSSLQYLSSFAKGL